MPATRHKSSIWARLQSRQGNLPRSQARAKGLLASGGRKPPWWDQASLMAATIIWCLLESVASDVVAARPAGLRRPLAGNFLCGRRFLIFDRRFGVGRAALGSGPGGFYQRDIGARNLQ